MDWHWVNYAFPNVWTLLVLAVVFYKYHRLRKSIEKLTASLPHLGDEFLKDEMHNLTTELQEVRARIILVEQHLGLNGEAA